MQPNWLWQRSKLTPERIGLRFGEESWTFRDLFERAEQVAQQLMNFVQPGGRAAVLASSTPDLLHVIYGCMHAQVEMVFLNTRLSEEELRYQIDDAAVQVIFVDEQQHARLTHDAVVPFETLFASKRVVVPFAEEWDEEQTVSIMYTSGTTGFPKGVRQTVGNHSASAISSALNLGLAEHDAWLCCVPIFHISGFSILMRSLLYGMTVELHEKFDAASCARAISDGTVTTISVVSVMLEQMLSYMEAQQLRAHSHFKTALVGGGPVPVPYLQRAFAVGLSVSQTYGMTETSSQTATLSSSDALRKLGSAGKPLFFNRIRIDGATAAREEGEICIRGPHVTPGYIGQFAAREATEEGWLKTGDIGYLDEEGYLYVVDRRADLMISGGENVYPAEIENVLASHPAVKEAGVCGQEDAKWGQVPVGFVVLREPVTETELVAYCKERLAHYKAPRTVYIVESLPRNGANKLLRRELRKML